MKNEKNITWSRIIKCIVMGIPLISIILMSWLIFYYFIIQDRAFDITTDTIGILLALVGIAITTWLGMNLYELIRRDDMLEAQRQMKVVQSELKIAQGAVDKILDALENYDDEIVTLKKDKADKQDVKIDSDVKADWEETLKDAGL